MKTKFYTAITFLTLLVEAASAQTGVSIAQSDFSTQQAAWTLNGSASFGTVNTSTALILTPSTGSQAGSAFWNQKINLASNASFSVFFSFQIDQNVSRADGLTFVLQQNAATTIETTGGDLGYTAFPGKSLAVEFDTYQNGYDPNNNHIAIDLNGNLNHSTNGGLVQAISTSTLDLADSKLKYVWIDYNGATNLFEVRISYTNSRPTTATLSTTSYNLSTILSGTSVYMGFTGGTGGCWERHSITSFYAINQYAPISTGTTTYVQDPVTIKMTSTTTILSSNGTQLPITITLLDGGGVGLANQTVNLSITSGTGTLSAVSGTTNSSGQLVVNLSTTASAPITVQSVAAMGGLSQSANYTVNVILPLFFSNFSASPQNGEVFLNWNLSSGENVSNLEILRSSDGSTFSTIASIESENGNISANLNSYYDKSPLPGTSFYRLQLNGTGGSVELSEVKQVSIRTNNGGIKILGNPVYSELTLNGLSQESGEIAIYNISGILVSQVVINSNSSVISIPCSQFTRGEYYVKIIQSNSSSTLKFLKL